MFSVKKNWQLQLQVNNICHINNMFRTRSLSLMYFVYTRSSVAGKGVKMLRNARGMNRPC